MSLMWPIPVAILLNTPPLMTLSPKRLNLNASSSDSFLTKEDDKGSRTEDGFEVTVAKLAERFETVKGRRQKKNKGKK